MGSTEGLLLKPTVCLLNVALTGGVTGVVDTALVDVMNERCLLADPPLTGDALLPAGSTVAQSAVRALRRSSFRPTGPPPARRRSG